MDDEAKKIRRRAVVNRYRAAKAEKGLCNNCARPALPGYKSCDLHRNRPGRQAAVAAGRCGLCRAEPVAPGYKTCPACIARQAEYARVRRANLAARKMCANNCGSPVGAGKKTCFECRKRDSERVSMARTDARLTAAAAGEWTGRHVAALLKMHATESAVDPAKRDRPLLRRIDRAVAYLHKRARREKRRKL